MHWHWVANLGLVAAAPPSFCPIPRLLPPLPHPALGMAGQGMAWGDPPPPITMFCQAAAKRNHLPNPSPAFMCSCWATREPVVPDTRPTLPDLETCRSAPAGSQVQVYHSTCKHFFKVEVPGRSEPKPCTPAAFQMTYSHS